MLEREVTNHLIDKTRYNDDGHATALIVAAQQYFQTRLIPTRVKACANYNIEEIINLAGIAAFTITPSDLETLSNTPLPQNFQQNPDLLRALPKTNGVKIDYPTYVDDEGRFRIDFSSSKGGLAQYKLIQVCVVNGRSVFRLANSRSKALAVFCDWQDKIDSLMESNVQSL